MSTNREQQLVDLCFQLVLTITNDGPDRSDVSGHATAFAKKTNAEKAEWVARQLRLCGFDTRPIGLSWGVLVKGDEGP